MTRLILITFLISLMFFSCATIPEISKKETDLKISDEELPKIVAIIPFENKTEEVGIANQVRRSFYNHFSSKAFSDIELGIIDEKIVQLERKTGEKYTGNTT